MFIVPLSRAPPKMICLSISSVRTGLCFSFSGAMLSLSLLVLVSDDVRRDRSWGVVGRLSPGVVDLENI